MEEQPLTEGARIEIFYGDRSFGVDTRIQTFAENAVNVTAFVDRDGTGFAELQGSPCYLDVVAGPAVRANVVVPSKLTKKQRELLEAFAKESGDTIAEHQGLREKLGLG